MKKPLILLLVLSILVGGVMWWRSHGKAEDGATAQQPPPPAEVSVITIAPETLSITKDLPGRTSAYRVAEIRPQVNGIILKRMFDEGSDVKEGQQLYQIDPAPYQAAFDSAKADLMRAEANVKSVQARSSRYAELVKIDAISRQEYDDARAGLQQAIADVEIARASLKNAKINLDYTRVLSPISGRIGKSLVTEGALVTANQAGFLATVQQLSPIYVDVTQSSGELIKLRRQFAQDQGNKPAPVQLLVEGDDQPYSRQGALQFSDVTVDQGTGSVQLRILVDNPEFELMPGMFVRARVEQSKINDAIAVPQKAVTRNPDGSASIWVVGEGNKAVMRPITVSEAVGDRWIVTKGLQPGERVIVEGTQKVQPDAVVKPVPMQQTAQAAPQSTGQAPAIPPSAEPQGGVSQGGVSQQGGAQNDISQASGSTGEATQHSAAPDAPVQTKNDQNTGDNAPKP